MQEENCITAHQRPILAGTLPKQQKKPEQNESLKLEAHTPPPASTAPHLTGCWLSAACSSSRRSFHRFLARPEKALLALPPPLPAHYRSLSEMCLQLNSCILQRCSQRPA